MGGLLGRLPFCVLNGAGDLVSEPFILVLNGAVDLFELIARVVLLLD